MHHLKKLMPVERGALSVGCHMRLVAEADSATVFLPRLRSLYPFKPRRLHGRLKRGGGENKIRWGGANEEMLRPVSRKFPSLFQGWINFGLDVSTE